MQHQHLAGKDVHPANGRAQQVTHLDLGTARDVYGSPASTARASDRHPPLEKADQKVETREPAPTPSLRTARDQAMASAAEKFKDDPQKLAQFRTDSADFERRMNQNPGSEAEIARTYQQVVRLLDGHSNIVPDAERVKIASEVMHRAAHPTESNQGNSFNCDAAAISNQLYSHNPSAAARAVADTTLTGSYVDAAGHKISLDHDTIATHRTQQLPEQVATGAEPRSHADQILQAVVRNEALSINLEDGTAQGYRYEIHKPTAQNPTGEFVYDYSTHPRTDRSRYYVGMDTNQESTIYHQMTGEYREFSVTPYAAGEQTLDQFRRNLQDRKGQYPLDVGVHLDREPFKSSMHGQDGSTIDHAITVESYDPKTDTVHYRNSAFGSRECTISGEALFNAMHMHRSDAEVQATSKQLSALAPRIASEPAAAEDVGRQLGRFLRETEPSQRRAIIDQLRRESGVDIEKLMTPQDQALMRNSRGFSLWPF
jgi:hypothetical protein